MSYSWKNKNEVTELCQNLKEQKFSLWLDQKDMNSGQIDTTMIEGINNSKMFLCCLSTDYCKEDGNALKEFRFAFGIKKPIVYVLFEDIRSEEERKKKLQPVSFHMGFEKFFKHKDIVGITEAINEKLNVRRSLIVQNNKFNYYLIGSLRLHLR